MSVRLYSIEEHEIANLIFGRLDKVVDTYKSLVGEENRDFTNTIFAQLNSVQDIQVKRAVLIGKIDEFFQSGSFYRKTRFDMTDFDWDILKTSNKMVWEICNRVQMQYLVPLRPHHFLNKDECIEIATFQIRSLLRVLNEAADSIPQQVKNGLAHTVYNQMVGLEEYAQEIQATLIPLFSDMVELVFEAESKQETFLEDLQKAKSQTKTISFEIALERFELNNVFQGKTVEKTVYMDSQHIVFSIDDNVLSDESIHLLFEGAFVDLVLKDKFGNDINIKVVASSIEEKEEV